MSTSHGSGAVQLTDFRGSYDTGGPRWSPDGKFISFISIAQGKQMAYVISAEGGKPEALIHDLTNWSLSE